MVLSDWLSLSSVVIAIIALVIQKQQYWQAELHDDTELRHKVASQLRSSSFKENYCRVLRSSLSWLDRKMGKPDSSRSLETCIIMAVIYSYISICLTWLLSGNGELGGLDFFSSNKTLFQRLIWTIFEIISPVAIFYICFWTTLRVNSFERQLKVWILKKCMCNSSRHLVENIFQILIGLAIIVLQSIFYKLINEEYIRVYLISSIFIVELASVCLISNMVGHHFKGLTLFVFGNLVSIFVFGFFIFISGFIFYYYDTETNRQVLIELESLRLDLITDYLKQFFVYGIFSLIEPNHTQLYSYLFQFYVYLFISAFVGAKVGIGPISGSLAGILIGNIVFYIIIFFIIFYYAHELETTWMKFKTLSYLEDLHLIDEYSDSLSIINFNIFTFGIGLFSVFLARSHRSKDSIKLLMSIMGGICGIAVFFILFNVYNVSAIKFIVLLLVMLPFINGFFDWLSWWATRKLGKHLCDSIGQPLSSIRQVITVAGLGIIDLVIGIILLLFLAFFYRLY